MKAKIRAAYQGVDRELVNYPTLRAWSTVNERIIRIAMLVTSSATDLDAFSFNTASFRSGD
jgi:hypothetical protein